MTYKLLLKCALKLVEEIIPYYDARSKKHQTCGSDSCCSLAYIGRNTGKIYQNILSEEGYAERTKKI